MSSPATQPPEEQKTEKKKDRPTLVVGLDWSMMSPAAVAQLWSAEGVLEKTWAMCFMQRRATPHSMKYVLTPTFVLTEWPMCEDENEDPSCKSRWGLCRHHYSRLYDWLADIDTSRDTPLIIDRHGYIEDYAYGCKKTNSFTKLAEDAGCMMDMLQQDFGIEAVPLPISTIKKSFSGKGNATKADMYQAYLRLGFPPLTDALRCQPDQNPLSDVVDALAVARLGWCQNE